MKVNWNPLGVQELEFFFDHEKHNKLLADQLLQNKMVNGLNPGVSVICLD